MMVVLFERLFFTAKTAIPPEAERKEAQSDYAKVCEMPLRFFACIFLRLFAVSFFTINYQLPTTNYQLSTFSLTHTVPLHSPSTPVFHFFAPVLLLKWHTLLTVPMS